MRIKAAVFSLPKPSPPHAYLPRRCSRLLPAPLPSRRRSPGRPRPPQPATSGACRQPRLCADAGRLRAGPPFPTPGPGRRKCQREECRVGGVRLALVLGAGRELRAGGTAPPRRVTALRGRAGREGLRVEQLWARGGGGRCAFCFVSPAARRERCDCWEASEKNRLSPSSDRLFFFFVVVAFFYEMEGEKGFMRVYLMLHKGAFHPVLGAYPLAARLVEAPLGSSLGRRREFVFCCNSTAGPLLSRPAVPVM